MSDDADYWNFVASNCSNGKQISGNWDKYREFAKILLGRFDFADKTVAEIGCGTGIIANFVRCCYPTSVHYFGTDISENMVSIAKHFFGHNVNLASSDRLPFEDSSVDFVWALDVLEHIPTDKKEDTYREMGRVLKPGGFIVINNPLSASKHELAFEYGFDQDDLAEMLSMSGTLLYYVKMYQAKNLYQFISAIKPDRGGNNGKDSNC
jgi:ubiquinone/menaquinone biosynthesis C-methylase UbiE